MKRLLLLLLCLPLLTNASDHFSIEEDIEKPDAIPLSVTSYLRSSLGTEINDCEIKKLDEAFEAKFVKISADSQALLVKPKNFCLCGVYLCPVWLFQITGSTANRIWFSQGTGGLELLDQEVNGYRHIREGGGSAGHGSESIWAWAGKEYKETYRRVEGMNFEKNCRETETYRLKNGKLKKVSTTCVED